MLHTVFYYIKLHYSYGLCARDVGLQMGGSVSGMDAPRHSNDRFLLSTLCRLGGVHGVSSGFRVLLLYLLFFGRRHFLKFKLLNYSVN